MRPSVRASFRWARVTALAAAGSVACEDAGIPPVAPSQLTSSEVVLRAAPAQAPPPGTATGGAPEGRPVMHSRLDDSEIAMVASDIDLAQVRMADLASSRARAPRLQRFARYIASRYTAVEEKLTGVTRAAKIEPTASPLATKLASAARDREQALMGQFDSDFDREYLAAVVLTQHESLDVIANELLPSVKDARLKARLEAMRVMVVDDLFKVQEIRASLGPVAWNR